MDVWKGRRGTSYSVCEKPETDRREKKNEIKIGERGIKRSRSFAIMYIRSKARRISQRDETNRDRNE